MEKNKVKVSVNDYEFSLRTDDDPSYVLKVADLVQRKINRTLDSSRMSREGAAIYAALDFCDQLQKKGGDTDELKEQIKAYARNVTEAAKLNDELKGENERLKREIAVLRKRVDDAQSAQSATHAQPAHPQIDNIEMPDEFVEEKSAPVSKFAKKGSSAPVQGFFSEAAFAESADATAEIMSFFEQKSFEEDDE